jgi:hypothetical protein
MSTTRGFVLVDDWLSTKAAGIWAVGDVNGRQPFTRVCQEEAKVAYANAFDGTRPRMQRHFLPHAIFTDPEIGRVGLTKERALAEGHDAIAGLVAFERVEKAELIGETTGFIKYVADRSTHRLLGCHVVGPAAADLVYDAVVVMRAGGRIDDLATAVGVFPTLRRGWRERREACSDGSHRRRWPGRSSPRVTVEGGGHDGNPLSGVRRRVRDAGNARRARLGRSRRLKEIANRASPDTIRAGPARVDVEQIR